MNAIADIGYGPETQKDRNKTLLEFVTVEQGYEPGLVQIMRNIRRLSGRVGNPIYETKPASQKQLDFIASLAGLNSMAAAQLDFIAAVYELDIGQAGAIINGLKN